MARITLILGVLTAVIALLGGFQLALNEYRVWRARLGKTGRWLGVILMLCLLPSMTEAACTGSSPTWSAAVWADIQSCHDNAGFVNGDTVNLASGSLTAASALVVTKAMTLMGAGAGSTIVTSTVASGTSLITVQPVANFTTRISGIEFNGTIVNSNYILEVNSCNTGSRYLRVDHNKFDQLRQSVFSLNSVLGVIDHNTFVDPVAGQPAYIGHVRGNAWGNSGASCTTNSYGDGSWAAADQFGTDQFVFFEDNTYTSLYVAGHHTLLDNHAGGRYVARYNSFSNGNLETHGQEAGRSRGGRAFEIYNNTFAGINTQNLVIYMRGGTGVVHDNAVYGYDTAPVLQLLENRSRDPLGAPFAGADGRGIWDVNHASNPFDTATATSAGTLTVTASAKAWTVNQWQGYTVRKTSGVSCASLTRSGTTVTATCNAHGRITGDYVTIFGANEIGYDGLWYVTVTNANVFTYDINTTPNTTATGIIKAVLGNAYAEIQSNTATELTFTDSLYGASKRLVFAVNDTLEINKVTHALDMPGRSQGSALNGLDTPTLPAGWNDQVTVPWYEWNNLKCPSSPPTVGCASGTDIDFSRTSAAGPYYILVPGTHYLTDETQKPSYTPYTYPHPLVGGGGTIPANFRLTGGFQIIEAILPILGISWHFRKALVAGSLAAISLTYTAAQAIPLYTARTYYESRQATAKVLVALLPSDKESR